MLLELLLVPHWVTWELDFSRIALVLVKEASSWINWSTEEGEILKKYLMKSQMLTLESLEKMVSIHVFSALEAEVVEADIADLIAELAIVIMITDATTSVISKLDYCF